MVSGYRSKVPFVPVPNSILKDIYKALEVKEGSVVYDLAYGEFDYEMIKKYNLPLLDSIGPDGKLL
jgi:hypothetical protein